MWQNQLRVTCEKCLPEYNWMYSLLGGKVGVGIYFPSHHNKLALSVIKCPSTSSGPFITQPRMLFPFTCRIAFCLISTALSLDSGQYLDGLSLEPVTFSPWIFFLLHILCYYFFVLWTNTKLFLVKSSKICCQKYSLATKILTCEKNSKLTLYYNGYFLLNVSWSLLSPVPPLDTEKLTWASSLLNP